MEAKRKRKYAQVVLAIDSSKMQDLYTYAIPESLESDVQVGSLVLVPVKKSMRRGIVAEITDQIAKTHYEIRNIISVYGPDRILDETGIELAKWIARYYRSNLYSAIRLLFWDIKTFKISTEYVIEDREKFLSFILEKIGLFGKPKKTVKIDRQLSKRKIKGILKSCEVYEGEQERMFDELLEKRLIYPVYQLARSKLKTEKVAYIPNENPPSDANCTPKEEEILLAVSDLCRPVTWEDIKPQFPNGRRYYTSLIKKGFLVETHVETMKDFQDEVPDEIKLTSEQKKAISAINKSIKNDSAETFLIEGVTGSGKTEIYIECAKQAIQKGSVIVLVPEIVLTLQIVERFKLTFGNRLFVLHSGLGQARLKRNWEVLRGSKNRIVIGPRSALFAPLDDVNLVIIDEEHEPAYKQERNPRYHARDVARKMSSLRNAILVFGSATPSVESRYLAEEKKYNFIELTKRIHKGGLPEVQMVDLQWGGAEGPMFLSPALINEIRKVLEREKQALLFLNQRGFSPSLVCGNCGYTPKCRGCNIAFTYHLRDNMLLCHHCGRQLPVIETCPACEKGNMMKVGFGTQRVEEEVVRLFPDAKVYRLDRDVASKGGIHGGGLALMKRFFDEHGDILVGTQMIGKGLDLPDVELVGVISADTSLNLPDFRAAERTFQLITQVAGRAGRRDQKGLVILQSYQPGHYAIESARQQDYESFFYKELALRKRLGYPPFKSLVRIIFRGRNELDVRKQVHHAANVFEDLVYRKAISSITLLGPSPAPLAMLAGRYRYHLILKADKVTSLLDAVNRIDNRMKMLKGVWMDVDINPINMM